mgnify:CR=1 FL=1
MSEVISARALRELIGGWLKAGIRVAGPRRVATDQVAYAWLDRPEDCLLGGYIHPHNSIKEFFFPRHESLYEYRIEGKKIALKNPEPLADERIVIGARPCDAAAMPILDHVFNWDFKDPFYNRRREQTTVVTLACREHDHECFCTSVGLGPDAERGSDVMLYELDGDMYEVRCVTDKGGNLMAGRTETSQLTGSVPPGPAKKFDLAYLRETIGSKFESPVWTEATLRCMACGACAYTCPTSHCFDIVDEGNARGGIRAKNWDACQFPMFTLHASGHNPRNTQPQRQRQRVMHKFSIYPDKFGDVLCTGCGNCTRHCSVHLGVQTVLEAAEKSWRNATV